MRFHRFVAVVSAFVGVASLPAQDLRIEAKAVHGRFDGGGTPLSGSTLTILDGRLVTDRATSPDVRRLLLPNGHVYPGLADAHAHLLGLGEALENVDLVGTTSFDEVVARVAARARTVPKGTFVRGRGWDQNDWPSADMPHHAALSAAVPDHPVYLTRIDGHAALVNAAAMTLAKLDAATGTPTGGEILKDETGAPTGVLIDAAMGLVSRHVPAADAAAKERWYLAAQQACLAAGLTSVHDAGIPPENLEILRRLHATGRWHLRVYAMLPGSASDAIRRGPWQTPDGVLVVRAVKDYADGALGSRGAWLLQPYQDQPGYRGLFSDRMAFLKGTAQLCADHGFQLCVHAIGDRANRAVLDVFEGTRFEGSRARARWRIEHAQVVAEPDFARFRELGVLASMQPTHLTSDMPWAERRLGAQRIAGSYAWQSFLALGVPVAFGSDFPVESHDPRKGLFAAVTTRAESGGPADGFRPEQRLDAATALHLFTLGAAFASFAERDLGSLEPGKLGDCTIFDRDLTTCAPDELLQARVLATVIGGHVRWVHE